VAVMPHRALRALSLLSSALSARHQTEYLRCKWGLIRSASTVTPRCEAMFAISALWTGTTE
jgi:hypothetical protein